MSRSKLREKTFRLLFGTEFHDRDQHDDQSELFFQAEEQAEMSDEDIKYVTGKCNDIVDKLSEIDRLLSEKTTGWSLSRIGKAELAILRLAVYEIVYDDSIPPSVSINEAVELAKKYGADESASFVNGVLAKFVK